VSHRSGPPQVGLRAALGAFAAVAFAVPVVFEAFTAVGHVSCVRIQVRPQAGALAGGDDGARVPRVERAGGRHKPLAGGRTAMTDKSTDPAVERFLDRAASAFDDYDQGYADADATLATLRTHVDELSASVEESDE